MTNKSDQPSAQPRYPRIAIDVPAQLADELSYELIEMGASGVEIRDATTLERSSMDDCILLLASFDSEQCAQQAYKLLDNQWNPRRHDVVGDLWREQWKQYFEPFELTEKMLVCPPWKLVKSQDKHVLVMDPGYAFGTGLHPTTKLVAQAIQSLDVNKMRVLDVGCGSGILGFCALLAGASFVRAIDNDPQAVQATIENALRNGLHARVQADTTDIQAITESYPLVVANIETRVLVPMAPALIRRVQPGGRLILSGILVEQKQQVLEAYKALDCTNICTQLDWLALELVDRL